MSNRFSLLPHASVAPYGVLFVVLCLLVVCAPLATRAWPGPVAVFEGVFGTLYLAVMIARLVGLNIVTGMRREENEP